jgi:hypothetical protein
MVDGLGNTCKSDTISSSLRNLRGLGLTNGEVKEDASCSGHLLTLAGL